MPKHRPLVTRTRAARMLLLDWRRACFSRDELADKSTDPKVAHEIARFDEAIETLRELTKLAKEH